MKIKVTEQSTGIQPDAIEEWLKQKKLFEVVEVGDAKKQYYQNDHDTLVLVYLGIHNTPAPDFDDGLHLAELAKAFNADEFNYIKEGEYTYFRYWWD